MAIADKQYNCVNENITVKKITVKQEMTRLHDIIVKQRDLILSIAAQIGATVTPSDEMSDIGANNLAEAVHALSDAADLNTLYLVRIDETLG